MNQGTGKEPERVGVGVVLPGTRGPPLFYWIARRPAAFSNPSLEGLLCLAGRGGMLFCTLARSWGGARGLVYTADVMKAAICDAAPRTWAVAIRCAQAAAAHPSAHWMQLSWLDENSAHVRATSGRFFSAAASLPTLAFSSPPGRIAFPRGIRPSAPAPSPPCHPHVHFPFSSLSLSFTWGRCIWADIDGAGGNKVQMALQSNVIKKRRKNLEQSLCSFVCFLFLWGHHG